MRLLQLGRGLDHHGRGAARDCLGAGDRSGIEAITLASTTLPYASLQNSTIAAGALALGDQVRTSDMGGSQRAGVSGLAIGASGLRMAYETYTQLLGRAGKRQLKSPSMGLTHNPGGVPYLGVAAISVLGLH